MYRKEEVGDPCWGHLRKVLKDGYDCDTKSENVPKSRPNSPPGAGDLSCVAPWPMNSRNQEQGLNVGSPSASVHPPAWKSFLVQSTLDSLCPSLACDGSHTAAAPRLAGTSQQNNRHHRLLTIDQNPFYAISSAFSWRVALYYFALWDMLTLR